MNKYDTILNLFKADSECPYTEYLDAFSIGNFAYSTNGNVLCRIPIDLCEQGISPIKDGLFLEKVLGISFDDGSLVKIDKSKILSFCSCWPIEEYEHEGLLKSTYFDGVKIRILGSRFGEKTMIDFCEALKFFPEQDLFFRLEPSEFSSKLFKIGDVYFIIAPCAHFEFDAFVDIDVIP